MAKRNIPQIPPEESTPASEPVEPQTPAEPLTDGQVEANSSESLDDKVARAVAKALASTQAIDHTKLAESMAKAMVTAQMALAQANKKSEHDTRMAELKRKAALEEKCTLCRQVVGDGKSRGCGGPWKRDPKTGEFITEPVMNPDGTQATDGEGKPMTRRIEDYHQFHVLMVVFPKDPVAVDAWDGIYINGAWYKSMGPNHEIWVPKHNAISAILGPFETNEREQRVGRQHRRSYGGSVSGKTGVHGINPQFM